MFALPCYYTLAGLRGQQIGPGHIAVQALEVVLMRMWKVLRQALLLGCAFCCSAFAAERQDQAPTLKIAGVLPSGVIKLEMHNSSKEPLRIFRESNSWGAARWRVFRIRKGELETFFLTTRYTLFTMNNPTSDLLQAGEKLEYRLDLSNREWSSSGDGKIGFESGDLLMVSYDVPLSREAIEEKVWWGVAATSMAIR